MNAVTQIEPMQSMQSMQSSVSPLKATHTPTRVLTRAETLDLISKKIPLNELGLPKFLYRCDLIPSDYNSLSPSEHNALLNTATIPITYREGYPTFYNGTPIWEQMDHEGDEDYALFTIYRNLGDIKGYRQLSAMPEAVLLSLNEQRMLQPARSPEPRAADREGNEANEGEGGDGTGTVDLATTDNRGILRKCHETASLYFWIYRAKAYDLFKITVHKKVRENRLMKVENHHFLEADRVLSRLLSKFDDIFSDEKMAAMTPVEFVKVMKEATSIQRTALGFDSAGKKSNNNGDDNTPANASLEVVMRSVAKSTKANEDANTTESNKNVIEILRGSPETAAMAQELVVNLRMGNRKKMQDGELGESTMASDERADLAMIHGDDND